MEHEVSLKQQQCENMERQLSDAKERLLSSEAGKHLTFEKQVEQFEQQRLELNQRIDRLSTENLEKDKQLASATHKLDRTADALLRKTSDLE